MATGEAVGVRALELARTEIDHQRAVFELMSFCEGRRVAAVRARQQLLAWLDSEPDQQDAMRAVGFLDELIEELPV